MMFISDKIQGKLVSIERFSSSPQAFAGLANTPYYHLSQLVIEKGEEAFTFLDVIVTENQLRLIEVGANLELMFITINDLTMVVGVRNAKQEQTLLCCDDYDERASRRLGIWSTLAYTCAIMAAGMFYVLLPYLSHFYLLMFVLVTVVVGFQLTLASNKLRKVHQSVIKLLVDEGYFVEQHNHLKHA
ncbi:hypothetical protein [Vibrio sp. WXL103]|uniref:hypothetical protein n=1 Tax=unclassified Vibrio TaxID=2614977 RepID=UPI003EC52C16